MASFMGIVAYCLWSLLLMKYHFFNEAQCGDYPSQLDRSWTTSNKCIDGNFTLKPPPTLKTRTSFGYDTGTQKEETTTSATSESTLKSNEEPIPVKGNISSTEELSDESNLVKLNVNSAGEFNDESNLVKVNVNSTGKFNNRSNLVKIIMNSTGEINDGSNLVKVDNSTTEELNFNEGRNLTGPKNPP